MVATMVALSAVRRARVTPWRGTQGLALGLRSASGPCVSYQRGAAASADMRCSNMRLRTGHHQDHGLGERYDVISESFVVAAE